MSFHKMYILTKILLVVSVAAWLSACAEVTHDTLRNISERECNDNPNIDERRDCKAKHHEVDYNEYRRIYEEK